jgi:AraC-like DNA-binding protein
MAPWHPPGPDQLIAELAARAPRVGANAGAWPGLTVWKFTSPAAPAPGEVKSLLVCIVAQGREAVRVDGETYVYDPFQYLVLGSHVRVEAEILEASAGRPFLSLVLQIDPGLVREVASAMLEWRPAALPSGRAAAFPVQRACASVLDQELLAAVLRFLGAVRTGMDRQVLAPLYLREMIYRMLQREQYPRLLALAAAESPASPVSAVLEYVRGHLAEPLTVSDMAELASLSPSAFAHLFRDVTGRPPYQLLKEMRLDRARELLTSGNLTVTRISKDVGYASVSHFISEFRGRFGVTPRSYRESRALPGA